MDKPPECLDIALPFAAALVALFRNIEQNRDSDAVKLTINPSKQTLIVTNTSKLKAATSGREKGGTEEVLKHYVAQYAGDRLGDFDFPDNPVDDKWVTALPLPDKFVPR